MRWFAGVIGLLIMLFGLACLNYTNGFGFEHHAEWARARGLPEPAYGLYVLGAAMTVRAPPRAVSRSRPLAASGPPHPWRARRPREGLRARSPRGRARPAAGAPHTIPA